MSHDAGKPNIPLPANNDVGRDHYLDNIYFRPELLAALKPDRRKRENIASRLSEDAVTWNVLAGLERRVEVPTLLPARGTLRLVPQQCELVFWNQVARECRGADSISESLVQVMRKCEGNPRRPSEIDAILWDRAASKVTFIEAKLTANAGVCGAVRTSLSDLNRLELGKKESKYECRLYRRSKPPRDNGCSYWGDGEGGEAFKARFPDDLVDRHLGFVRPDRNAEYRAPCAVYYQLMRNIIVGQETTSALKATSFEMVAIVAERYYQPKYYQDFLRALGPGRGVDFKLVTWQDIARALPEEEPVRVYIDRHDILCP